MKVEYYKEYSHCLGKDMEFKVYGHAGVPFLVFPCQDGRYFDFEDRKMYDLVRDHIDAGRVQFFACDSIDPESSFIDKEMLKNYPIDDFHRVYICEIEDVLVKK